MQPSRVLGPRLRRWADPEGATLRKLGIDPPTHVVLDVIRRATRIDDRGGRCLPCGCYERLVERNPHFGSRTACAGFAIGKARTQVARRTRQAQEVHGIEVAEEVAVREDLFGQHHREVHDHDVVLREFVSEAHQRPPEGRVVRVR
jgi:hypothetical protein